MPPQNLLIIVGYGGNRQGHSPELDALTAALSKRLEIPVRPAFLEADAPSVGECIQDGVADYHAEQVIVLPLHLGATAAQKKSVGLILDAAYDRWPDIPMQEAGAPATHPGVIAAHRELLAVAVSSFSPTDLSETALLVVERGSREAESNADVYQMAHLLWENSRLGSVEVAFFSRTQPDMVAGIKRCVQSGAQRIVILPYVLYDHRLYDAIQARVQQIKNPYPDVEIISAPHLGLQNGIVEAICQRYEEALAKISSGVVRIPQLHSHGAGGSHSHGLQALLPPRYQADTPVSAAPMGSADLLYDGDGRVAWDQIWGSFCDLALAGGPPHRGTLLEPVVPHMTAHEQERYQQVLAELARGIHLVTKLPIVASASPGWIGVQCSDEAMALWLLRAIIVENVSVRRESDVLYLPAGPDFRLEHEIKNVITVIAKTHHYWTEHLNNQSKDEA